MNTSDTRVRLFIGAVMLVVGAGLAVYSSRVLATLFLDVVVQTIAPNPGQPLPPYDYSWGTMHFGRSPADFTALCVGLLLIAVAHLLVIPVLIQRIKSVAAGTRTIFPKLAMAAASLMGLLAAGSFLLIPVVTRSAFGMLRVSGAADPVALGEDLPVLSSQIFMVCLVAVQILILLAIFTLPKSSPVRISQSGRMLSLAACACVLLFVLLMTIIRLGPVRVFTDLDGSVSKADPFEMAGQVALVINLMFAGGPLLVAAAILTTIAVFSPAKSEV